MSDSGEFRKILNESGLGELTPERIERVVSFREEVLRENALQNLTRLTGPREFFEGHVLDVIHLERSGMLTFPALDLGAGMGVPGILHAIIFTPEGERTWISSDSESKKADFGARMIQVFELEGCLSDCRRGEELLIEFEVETVVARAVGPLVRLFGWIRNRSTWNKLVLLKGPKWDEEWKEFKGSMGSEYLEIEKTIDYTVGEAGKRLKLIQLKRC